jgi:DNA-directed RNA polymerase specialized sigma24 family protein
MDLTEVMLSENMDAIIDSMNAYAISVLKSVGIKDFEGRQPVDFVGEVLLKVIDGTRDWKKAECSFKEFLFGCLKSDISSFFKTIKKVSSDEIPEIPANDNPINLEEKRKHLLELLKEEGSDDDELTVFEYWMDGIFKPSEIGADLGVDPKDIYVIIKRLKRRLEKIELEALKII